METNNLTKKEIIESDINIPLPNIEINNIENNNKEKNEENFENPQPKLKLKKKAHKLKMPKENSNISEEQIPIPNVEIEVINNNDVQNPNNANDVNENKVEIKNEEIIQEDNNKGYLDDDLEDEDNQKLYLRVIKRIEKTYGVPVIAAEIKGEKIEDIELEENIRPILIDKVKINNKETPKKNMVNNKDKYNINNKVINNGKNKENIINNSFNYPNVRNNNPINNDNYYSGKKPNINNNSINNNNLANSLNFNYKSYINYGPKYYLSHTGLYNKIINNKDLLNKYRNYTGKNFNSINPKIIRNKGNTLPKPRKNSYEKVNKNFQKRLNKKYPIYDPNNIDIAMNKFNNLKYYNLIDDFPNFSDLKKLNQRKYTYPLKRTYYISYNNKNKQNNNFINSKSNKNKNYFDYNSLNINKTPIIPKTNNKYFKNNYKNYNLANPLNNAKQVFNTNKNKNILLNKSANIPKGKNNFYNYTGNMNKYYYERNNQNFLSHTQEIIERSNKENKLIPFRSYNNNNYHLNYNYSNEENINNEYNSGFKMPIKEIKFTYYINSRYN